MQVKSSAFVFVQHSDSDSSLSNMPVSEFSYSV